MASAQPLSPFEEGVGYIMHLWPALTLAVSQSWGGPDSNDKRDWFVGSICELFEQDPATDGEDVEYRLLQVMSEEFEVEVDDESAWETAENIMKLRKSCIQNETQELQAWKERWQSRTRSGAGDVASGFHKVETREEDQETDGSDDEEGDGDVEMDEAPPLVRAPKEKPVPEVDEDGFTTVVGKKKK